MCSTRSTSILCTVLQKPRRTGGQRLMASSTSTTPVILSRTCGGVQPYPYTTGSVAVSTNPSSNPTLIPTEFRKQNK
ncbi:hypothetical protein Hanom_Chr07g00594971 [Helianthus anomalus]